MKWIKYSKANSFSFETHIWTALLFYKDVIFYSIIKFNTSLESEQLRLRKKLNDGQKTL